MTKKISTFVFIGLIFTIIAWISDKNSLVAIDWRGIHSQYSIPEAMLIVLLFVAVVDLISRLIRKLVEAQVKDAYRNSALDEQDREDAAIDVIAGKISEKIVINRSDFDASLLLVLKAMTAITAGDMKEARIHLKELKRLVGKDPIIDVLLMKIYKGERDFDKMEKLSARLMKNTDVQIVGMKAAVEAQMEKKEFTQALATANRAFELRQDLYWVIESAFELRAKAKDWEGAMQVLDAGIKKKLIPADRYKRFKSIILYEIAMEYQNKDDDVNFFKYICQAIEADETLVPAAIALARYYVANDNQFRKAAKVLSNAWKKNPVDEIAYEYLKLWPKDDILEQIRRLESFSLSNGKRPSLNNRLLAELSAKAGLWGKSKSEFEIFLINNPCTKIISDIIANYEKFNNNDKEAAKFWTEKKETCADDSQWVCDACGTGFDNWSPICPHCGEFGQEKWHLYVEKDIDTEEPESEAIEDDE